MCILLIGGIKIYRTFVLQLEIKQGTLTRCDGEGVKYTETTYGYGVDTTYNVSQNGVYVIKLIGSKGQRVKVDNVTGEGGCSGYSYGVRRFSSGDVLYIRTGEYVSDAVADFASAPSTFLGSGGGGSDIRLNGTDIDKQILVAAGGGGGVCVKYAGYSEFTGISGGDRRRFLW